MGRAEDDLINSITLWFLLAFLLFLLLFNCVSSIL